MRRARARSSAPSPATTSSASSPAKKTAFLISGPWPFADIKKAKLQYDISPVPAFDGGKPARPFVGVEAFYVASKGKNKPLAQEFVTNYWSTPEVDLALYKASPTARRSPPRWTRSRRATRSW